MVCWLYFVIFYTLKRWKQARSQKFAMRGAVWGVGIRLTPSIVIIFFGNSFFLLRNDK